MQKEPSDHLLNELKMCTSALIIILTTDASCVSGEQMMHAVSQWLDCSPNVKQKKGTANILDCLKLLREGHML